MPNLYVFEPERGGFVLSSPLPENPMPHVRRFFFPVSDFVRGARSAVCWTDARALSALDALCAAFPAPFSVASAFRRFPDTRRSAGLCFSLVSAETALLRSCCLASGLFCRVSSPFSDGHTVTVSVDVPLDGDAGVQVFALQDALMYRGLYAGPLTGTLTADTRRALKRLTNAGADARIVIEG